VEEFGVTLVALEPVDRVDVTTLVDNTADMLLPDVGPVRRWGLSGTSGSLPVAPSGAAVGGSTLDFLRAEHGYSALVDVYRGGRMHRVLYDTGVSPFGLVENLDRLGISPDTFQAIVLSHGHFDHLLVTGEVPRRTAFETGLPPGHQAWVDGQWRHDPLVHEDQALVAHVRGRGLVIVTGWGHAGIVNIVRQAKRLTGVDLYDAMPQAYRPNSVGSRFELKAAPETNPGAAVAGPTGRTEVTT
jgi:metal-dependent hydrolase (beta-lactamase superfamily II)